MLDVAMVAAVSSPLRVISGGDLTVFNELCRVCHILGQIAERDKHS